VKSVDEIDLDVEAGAAGFRVDERRTEVSEMPQLA
jgi:hypothetical protein